MLNEPMDDDGEEFTIDPDWDEPVTFEDDEPVVQPDPPGTVRRDFAGVEVLLRIPVRAQTRAVLRAWEAAIAESRKMKGLGTEEAYIKALEISERLDVRILDFVESLVVNPADVDRLLDLQIVGKLQPFDMFNIVLGSGPAQDDDAEPVEQPKPKAKKKPAPVKKAANARRTQK